ncbi:lipopolysaccharide transport periplasmic protein LptA [Gilvimarinus sp. F26214L]|uniref:lipopolysaccharide transport periplasmic protein LptA n=1 Tax=Gilvimarinus sp. DZF01 TaxID=3461371 RepID=UPI004045A5F5
MSPTLKQAAAPLLCLALVCAGPPLAFGLPTDSQQQINLSFDTSNLDLKKGVAVYQGNVKLTQGSLRIESDELVVHRKGEVIEKVIATGSPAIFEQQPEPDQAPVIAQGKRIEYELQAQVETVAVVDDAVVEQAGIVSRCERIEFNLTESTAKMMGSCVTERPAQPAGNTPSPTNGL